MKYPLMILLFFWMAGLMLGSYIPITKILLLLLVLVGILLLLISLIHYRRHAKLWFYLLTFSMVFFALTRMGFFVESNTSNISTTAIDINETNIGVRGYIDSKPIIDGNMVKLIINPISYQIDGDEHLVKNKERFLTYIFLQKEEELTRVRNWGEGDSIALFGKLSKPFTLHNPGLFDYQKYLERKSIFWTLTVNSLTDVRIAEGKNLSTGLSSIREYVSDKIDSLFSNRIYSGFLESILLGERENLANDIREDFSIVGLSHLLAISGLHLSIISLLLFWTFSNLGLTRQKTIVIVSILLILYMFLTGGSPSVVRATIMTILVMYGLFFRRTLFSLQTLAIAFIVMTIYQPVWIYDVGFQLSFTITFFIIWGYPKIYQRIPINHRLLKNALTVLVITQFSSLPITLYYFHQYSLLSWILNLIIVPIFSTIILPLGFVIILFASFHLYIAHPLATMIEYLLKELFVIVDWSANIQFLHFYGTPSSLFMVGLMYLILIWVLIRGEVKDSFIRHKIKNIIFLTEKLTVILIILLVLFTSILDNEGVVSFVDVGQGDSSFIETPKGYTILIDSGGKNTYTTEKWKIRKDSFDVGEDVILPYLHYRGTDYIDLAILTHEDYDHLGGYLTLIDKIEIGAFIVPEEFPRTEAGNILKEKIIKKGINLLYISNLRNVQIENSTKLTFIPFNMLNSSKENDHTFILYLQMYDTKILYSSDLEEIGEDKLVSQYNLRNVDILKVGHHGSNTSSSEQWLDTLKPKDGIISVGLNNRYGHPSEIVLNRLKAHRMKIWRTDMDGAMIVYIDDDGYKIEKTVSRQ